MVLAALIAMAALMLSGCAGKQAPADEPSAVPTVEELYPLCDETATLTTFPYNLNGLVSDFNGVACYQEAEKRTNVHIEFNLQHTFPAAWFQALQWC